MSVGVRLWSRCQAPHLLRRRPAPLLPAAGSSARSGWCRPPAGRLGDKPGVTRGAASIPRAGTGSGDAQSNSGNVLRQQDEDWETSDAALRDWTHHTGARRKGSRRWGTQTGIRAGSGGCSGSLNRVCHPPCSQNPGEVSQAQLHRYWGAKSWGRSWPDPSRTSSSSAENAQTPETPRVVKTRGAARHGSCASPQCPWEVYGHKQTSQAMSSSGKVQRIFLIAWMAGVSSASAAEPLASCEQRNTSAHTAEGFAPAPPWQQLCPGSVF